MVQQTIFHESWWLDIAAPDGWDVASVVSGGEVMASIPWVRSRSLNMPAMITPALCRVLHPVVVVRGNKKESVNRALLGLVGDLIDSLPAADFSQCVLGPDWTDALAWQTRGFRARPLYTYVTHPPRDDAALLDQIRDTTRRVIRRAREALTLEDVSGEAFTELYARFLGDARPYFSLDRIALLHAATTARDQGRAIVARDATGQVHSAVFMVWDAHNLYYFMTTRDPERAHAGAVAMLVVEAMGEAARRGLCFDFDGITTPERLRFMVNFGGTVATRMIVERTSPLYDAASGIRRVARRLRGKSLVLAD